MSLMCYDSNASVQQGHYAYYIVLDQRTIEALVLTGLVMILHPNDVRFLQKFLFLVMRKSNPEFPGMNIDVWE